MEAEPTTIAIDGGGRVSGLWLSPPAPGACLALAHGAGAGMAHRSMAAIAEGLAQRGVATLRYQFPFMERGARRVDPPALAHAAVRAAATEARRRAGPAPLFAGGRSFGGRMTSQAQAIAPLEGVRGLVFFAFPLHPAGKPSGQRAEHLEKVAVPMLFLQGSRDALADVDLLKRTVAELEDRARLELVDGADHAFHIPARDRPARGPRSDADAMADVLSRAAAWMAAH